MGHKMQNLQGVADTTYIPLVARIYVTEHFPEFFCDEKAVEVGKKIPPEALNRIRKKSSEYAMIASVARYHVLDRVVRTFVSEHPEGCGIINLGAGLETMAARLNLPKAMFYEVDLPETVELREAFLEPLPNEVVIAGDMFELSWIHKIDTTVPLLIIVSGVFQYFSEEKNTSFIQALSRHLPGSEIIFDATNEVGAKYANRYVKKTGNASAEICFYINDAQEFARKIGMRLLDERVFYTEARQLLGKRLKLYTRIAMKVCDDKKRAIFVHLQL